MTDELPNNLRLRKYQENFIEVKLTTGLTPKMKILSMLPKKLLENRD